MPASTSTLPSGPVSTATFPPEPSSTLILLRSLWVTIAETAALSLMRLTRPRASANAARGVSHSPVAVKAAPPTQHRQNPRRDMIEECFAVIVLSMPLPRGAPERRSHRPPVKPSYRPERSFLFRDHEVDDRLVDHPVCWIGKFDQDAMRSRGQALDDQWLAARVHPMPGSVIHGEVEMSDPRRHIERPGPKHRHDAQIFGPILNDDQPAGERIR